jgi:hypothetical protein
MLDLDDLVEKYCPDQTLSDAFALKSEARWYGWRDLKYFLYEYEESLCRARHRSIKISWPQLVADRTNHTIEHILPRAPVDEYWTSRFSPELRGKYTDDIGNLCLTLDNSAYSRKSFPRKKGHSGSGERCYAEGDLVMERELVAYEDWDGQAILDRRAKMVSWALDRWSMSVAREGPVQS